MRHPRLLFVPLVMLFVLACGLTNGIQQMQQAVTQLPGMLTSMPTAMGAMETSAAGAQSSGNCPATPTSGGLGFGLANAKAVLTMTQQFTFTDGTVNGQPASTATLASGSAGTFSSLANGFSAQFIGDPCNLSEVTVTMPRVDQATIDQGIGVANILFAAILPPDVQVAFTTWLTQKYSKVPVGGQEQTTISNLQFTLKRTQASMILDILPAK
ncbi:MAG TPA: hypothetical protein VMC09_16845 [Anaerolineales bacterium]|nr:hypothetical protein [Anaerolineales bacterium]